MGRSSSLIVGPQMHTDKQGLRSLGIAESFDPSVGEKSVLAGVIMRADRVIDGTGFELCTVGGTDSTEAVVNLHRRMHREDVNVLMLNGCIISWFNVIDLNRVYKELGIPLICVTYDPSEGIRHYFEKYFPGGWRERVTTYEANGPRSEAKIHTGFSIYLRCLGLEIDQAIKVLNRYILNGRVPEPLRVARLLARSVLRSVILGSTS